MRKKPEFSRLERKRKAELAKTVQDELADKIKKRLVAAKSLSSASPSSTSSSGSETLSSSSTSASSTSASSTSASTTSAFATSSMPSLDILQHDEAIDLSTKRTVPKKPQIKSSEAIRRKIIMIPILF
ncbi:uncharacterized protein LOC131665712 [Phymastichus coffea]|uniref:uncharacterized protein LOC131665712 n=1 Tax=Phymastichus coffea TaxID=108790 RepID=UPI00273C3A58|nr:uncharacterized protein LOC131665712 [Phymastichus coffea]